MWMNLDHHIQNIECSSDLEKIGIWWFSLSPVRLCQFCMESPKKPKKVGIKLSSWPKLKWWTLGSFECPLASMLIWKCLFKFLSLTLIIEPKKNYLFHKDRLERYQLLWVLLLQVFDFVKSYSCRRRRATIFAVVNSSQLRISNLMNLKRLLIRFEKAFR